MGAELDLVGIDKSLELCDFLIKSQSFELEVHSEAKSLLLGVVLLNDLDLRSHCEVWQLVCHQ